MTLWSFRFLRPCLFRLWERRRRKELESVGRKGAPLAVGDRAPEFELPDDSGRLRRSGEWLGPGGAIVWFTNLCEVCADQARDLAELRRRGRIAAPVVAIHLPGPGSRSPAGFRNMGADFPILIDDGSVGRAWTGEAVPDT